MKIYLETYGCTLNQADSEIIKSILSNHKFLANEKDADIVIINSCAVKGSTENKILNRIKKLSYLKERLIITGCLSIEEEKIRKICPSCNILYPGSIRKIKEIVDKIKKNKHSVIRSTIKKPITKIIPNGVILKLPIQEGCLNQCTYCITKFTRPKLFSYPIKTIKHIIKRHSSKKCIEVQLCGMDTGVYGIDRNTNLVELLKSISDIKNKFYIRLGMLNPQHAIRMLDDLVEIYKDEHMYKFLHIPIQSGSDKVLNEMKRNYTIKTCEKIINKFRKNIPSITISTDIIVGYPTETEEDFQKTINFLKKIKFDIVNLSKFTPRPYTYAKKLKQLPSQIIKNRSRIIHKLIDKIERDINKKYVGKKLEVFITEKNKGRSINYKQVIVNGKIGGIKEVKIKSSTKTSLIG